MTGLLARVLGDGLFRLEEPIVVQIIGGKQPFRLVVPAKFETDFASIPSVLHWVVRPTDSRIMRAAVVHDWCYCTHICSRAHADALFYSVMREDGMARWKAKLCFQAVNWFGKRGYAQTSPRQMHQRTPSLYSSNSTAPPKHEGAVYPAAPDPSLIEAISVYINEFRQRGPTDVEQGQ